MFTRRKASMVVLTALARDRLNVLLNDWLCGDDRREEDWEVIEGLYKGYTMLGGNGTIRELYEEAKEMREEG